MGPRPSATAPPGQAGWGRLPDEARDKVIALAVDRPELSPRELAGRFTHEERCLVSEVRRGRKRFGGPFNRRTCTAF